MKKILLVIDVQSGLINQITKEIPMKIARFIQKKQFDCLIFSQFINHENSNWYKAGWKKMMGENETQITSELQEYSNHSNTFTKTAFSVFSSIEFRKFIKAQNITDL